jgi:uncharacterized protein YjbI with pentapeptide repeats
MKSATRNGIQAPQIPKRLGPALFDVGDEREPYFQQVLLADHDQSDLKTSGLFFEQVHLQRVIFMQSRLQKLRAFDSRFERCDLSGADWEKARFRRVEFTDCRLLGTAILEGSFEDTFFRDCNAEGASFVSAVFHCARFEKCNLQGASFEGADLTGVVFEGCNLARANLRGAKLTGADFSSAVIDGLRIAAGDLQGAIIAPLQAVQVVGLLGIHIKSEPD